MRGIGCVRLIQSAIWKCPAVGFCDQGIAKARSGIWRTVAARRARRDLTRSRRFERFGGRRGTQNNLEIFDASSNVAYCRMPFGNKQAPSLRYEGFGLQPCE